MRASLQIQRCVKNFQPRTQVPAIDLHATDVATAFAGRYWVLITMAPKPGLRRISNGDTNESLAPPSLATHAISLTDELTPKQQHAQKALDPDRIALRSKGFRTWFRHGTLWYLDQGVPRECKQGEAVRLPQAQGSPPRPNIPAARAPPRGPSSHPRQTPGRSGGSIPAGTPRANRVVAPVPASCQAPRPASPNASPPGPSYAFVAGSDPATAMDTGPAAPAGPSAGPTSAVAAAPSCTPTATPPVGPVSSPAGPLAPTNPQ